MTKSVHSRGESERPSHNLLGQRLGRKGHDTRERILAAMEKLLAPESEAAAISLSAVAREASLGMTTLYLYFNDLSEILLAVLDRTTVSAEEAYLAQLRKRWADEELGARCKEFLTAYCYFWVRHERLLHMRNAYVVAGDERLREHRIATAEPVINLLVRQLDGDPDDTLTPAYAMATALWTGAERSVTVLTDATFKRRSVKAEVQGRELLAAEARLMELGIRDYRGLVRR